jgi:hypothetical protein
MCYKKDCPKSQKCYRYRAVPDQDQRYYDFTYLCQENNKDDENNYRYFIIIRKDDKIVELDKVKELESGEIGKEKESENNKTDNSESNGE